MLKRRGGFRSDIAGGTVGAVLGSVLVLAGLVFMLTPEKPAKQDEPVPMAPVLESRRFGLAEESPRYTAAAYAAFPEAFAVEGGREDNRRRNIRLTDALLNVYGDWKNVAQVIGDCVAANQCHPIQIRAAIKGKKLNPFRPYTYGLARVTIGKNRPGCNSDGAVSSWAIEGFLKHGWLEAEEAGIPYTAKNARDWGCNGPPAWAIDKAKGRTGDAHPIRSLDELIEALGNGYPCTYAGLFGTDEATIRVVDGRWVAEWNDRWPHQMCFVGWDGSLGPGREYATILNSWGERWPDGKPPMNGEIPGSFNVTAATVVKMIQQGEVWAISDVRGFTVDPDEIDWSVFDVTARGNVAPASDVVRSKRKENHVSYALAP